MQPEPQQQPVRSITYRSISMPYEYCQANAAGWTDLAIALILVSRSLISPAPASSVLDACSAFSRAFAWQNEPTETMTLKSTP